MFVGYIAAQNGIADVEGFASFIKENYRSFAHAKLFTTSDQINIDDGRVSEIVQAYKAMIQQRNFIANEEQRIAELVRTMPLTSGHNYEGFRIVRYGGYVSGDEVATIPRTFFLGNMSNDAVSDTVKSVRSIAINELKHAAANIDCNAIIGLDFDYITLEDDRGDARRNDVKIILTANGTAVEIEPL